MKNPNQKKKKKKKKKILAVGRGGGGGVTRVSDFFLCLKESKSEREGGS